MKRNWQRDSLMTRECSITTARMNLYRFQFEYWHPPETQLNLLLLCLTVQRFQYLCFNRKVILHGFYKNSCYIWEHLLCFVICKTAPLLSHDNIGCIFTLRQWKQKVFSRSFQYSCSLLITYHIIFSATPPQILYWLRHH